MGVPLRKMPADWEREATPGQPDPFRYGWRWRTVHLPSGEVLDEQVPLTADDLLDPQPGDQVGQSQLHWEMLFLLARILDWYYEVRDDVTLAVDLKMLWRIPGLKEPSPDLAVIPGVRRKIDPARTSFDVVEEGVRPCLILEVVSATDPEIRRNDYEKKVEIYQKVGIQEYIILDPPTPVTGGRLLLLGYRLGRDGKYQQIQPDAHGRLLSKTTSLLFGVGEDGQSPLIFDLQTGERLLDPKEEAERAKETALREIQARKAAEELAARETEARKAAEAELARLRAELKQTRP
ncbi:MAG TPA: Uma2 family endonuclease [Thermoanaerobaculia bacterium]|nr:Uma2 family endonuclease [Thermoanaerobaculia bacterium]